MADTSRDPATKGVTVARAITANAEATACKGNDSIRQLGGRMTARMVEVEESAMRWKKARAAKCALGLHQVH